MSHARRQWPAPLRSIRALGRAARLRLGAPAKLHRWLAVVTWPPFVVAPRRPTNCELLEPHLAAAEKYLAGAFLVGLFPVSPSPSRSQTKLLSDSPREAAQRLPIPVQQLLLRPLIGRRKSRKKVSRLPLSLRPACHRRAKPQTAVRGFERLHQIQQQSTLVPATTSHNAEAFVLRASLHSPKFCYRHVRPYLSTNHSSSVLPVHQFINLSRSITATPLAPVFGPWSRC